MILDVAVRGIWEFGFLALMLCTTIGVIYSMLTEKHGHWDSNDFVEIAFIVLIPALLLFVMQSINVGNVHDTVDLIITEYYGWWEYLALLVAVYTANKFMVKR